MVIKVCGMRAPANIAAVNQLDIDMMGFIFYSRSPRYVPLEGRYTEAIRQCRHRKVGVFVNEDEARIMEIMSTFRLDYIQLHGMESPDFCRSLRQRGYGIIKAFHLETPEDLCNTDDYQDCSDYYLFDTKCHEYGGSGRRFDWAVIDHYRGMVPFLLSGGLAFEHIHEIQSFHHPRFAGIDLNSGFELSPAVKDVRKLNMFIQMITNEKSKTNEQD